MNTTENNKLIAEFMELEATPKYNPKEYYIKEYNSGEWYLPEEMQYHNSWDWLMPVIQKVNEVSGYNDYNTDRLHIQRVLDDCISENAVGIDEVHKAVVEFINQNNKNNE